MKEEEAQEPTGGAMPSLATATKLWLKIGLLSFGGPAGQIGLMHHEVVEKRRWVSEERFLHALNYCMLLPGPEAQQLAIYLGWILHRVWGGIVAGALFFIPGAVLLWLIAFIYVQWSDVPAIEAVFDGLKPAVMAIVALAVVKIGKKILKSPLMWTVAGTAFVAIFVFGAPFPAIILSAGVLGILAGRYRPQLFPAPVEGVASAESAGEQAGAERIAGVSHKRALGNAGLWVVIWMAPLAAVFAIFGPGHTLTQEGVFFTKAALVTFGGAYAVLPYVAQQAVEVHQWLSAGEMLDGLGLAETTPGPLVLVLQFVGFLGAWHHPGELSPLLAATLGAGLTTWLIFVPGFLFIFAGAPYNERLRGNRHLKNGLSAITAAIVGVILNLAIWFGVNVLFPEPWRLDLFSAVVFVAAAVALYRWGVDVIYVISGAALAGLAFYGARLFLG